MNLAKLANYLASNQRINAFDVKLKTIAIQEKRCQQKKK